MESDCTTGQKRKLFRSHRRQTVDEAREVRPPLGSGGYLACYAK